MLIPLFLLFAAFVCTPSTAVDRGDPVSDAELLKNPLLIRRISSGYVRGKRTVTPRGVEGVSFFSVPIAAEPVGELRFRRPVPRPPWQGVLNTTEYRYSCWWNSTRTHMMTGLFIMNEDCIHVSVFTNRHCLVNGGCAVAFYLMGGNFAFGTPLQFNPEFLIENYNNVSSNVVLVTISHRVTAFGVLNLNWRLQTSADLNAGLHDVIHGLKWVQDEISVFGGDPNKVTLMGHSAGALIVDLLSVSPKTEGLFHQLVIMSRPTSNLELVPDRNQRISRYTARHVGCVDADVDVQDSRWNDTDFVEAVIQCLRTKPASAISGAQPLGEPFDYKFNGASLDFGKHAILPSLYAVLQQKRRPYPLLIGTVSKEFLDSRDTVIGYEIVDQARLRTWSAIMLNFSGYEVTESAVQNVMQAYNRTSRSIFMYDDMGVYVPTVDVINSAASQGSKVYVYEWIYADIGDAYIIGEGIPNPAPELYPGHSHELIYLMGQHLGNFTIKDHEIKYLYSQIYMDFIKTGSPATKVRKWVPWNAADMNFYQIDFPDPTLESPGMKYYYHRKEWEYWTYDVPKFAGNRHAISSETEYHCPEIVQMNLWNETVARGEVEASDANWQVMFWVAVVILVVVAAALIVTCIVAKRHRNQYETL